MVAKVKPKARSVAVKAKAKAEAPAPAKVRLAATWPFPTPGVEMKKTVKKPLPSKELDVAYATKKHVVKATLSNVELAKARSALSLDLYANAKKIGNLEVGQGSFFWTGAGRKKSKPIDWSTFAAMMNHLAYGNK